VILKVFFTDTARGCLYTGNIGVTDNTLLQQKWSKKGSRVKS